MLPPALTFAANARGGLDGLGNGSLSRLAGVPRAKGSRVSPPPFGWSG